MKIGILTFHRALNYGAVLQCYALFEALKGLGHDVEVIDYRAPYIEKYRQPFYKKEFMRQSLMTKIMTLFLLPISYIKKRRASNAFNDFLRKYIKTSDPVFNSKDIPSYYDSIIFGSDQIWNPRICEGFDPIYWGQMKKESVRYIAYATSLEIFQQLTPQQWTFIGEAMNNFDAVAVRENSFREELAKHTQREIKWVVDPTLLISPLMLKKLVKNSSLKRFVFLFTVQEGGKAYQIAQRIAQEKNCVVVRARAITRLNIRKKEKNVIHINSITPNRFVELIQNAECVVTNSFHATAISIQLEKDFYSVECNRSNRIIGILDAVGLLDRYITDINTIKTESSIDYTTVRRNLSNFANQSLEYLITNLS